MKYEPTIIRLKKFKEAEEIKKLNDKFTDFKSFISYKAKNGENKAIYIQFREILIRINNIEVTYNRKNIEF